MCACQKSYTLIIMTSITWACPRCVQEAAAILACQIRLRIAVVTVGVIINGALSRGKMSIISVPLVIKSTVCRCTRPCAAVLPAKCGIPTTGPTFPPTTAPIGPGHNSLKIAKINKRNHRKLSLTHDLTWPLSCQTKKSTKHNPHEVTHHKISTHPSQ